MAAATTSMRQHRDQKYRTVAAGPPAKKATAAKQQEHHGDQEAAQQAVPMLLLEGDEFFVNHDGVCRTYYELVGEGRQSPLADKEEFHQHNKYSFLGLEEAYHLKSAKKMFVLRTKDILSREINQQPLTNMDSKMNQQKDDSTLVLSKRAQGVVRLGRALERIMLQEIDQGVFGSAGTGATTWEASIGMALLYHSSLTPLLKGRVLELGSGVGLGGILLMQQLDSESQAGGTTHQGVDAMASLTLTDGNDEVLRECRHNWHCHRAYQQQQHHSTTPVPLYIRHLDWHAPPTITSDEQRYDTILASDCAYKHTDIVALAATMKLLLRPTGKIHIFGPYNRGALQQLVLELKMQGMDVQLNGLEMNRYRLKSAQQSNSNEGGSTTTSNKDDEESVYCSRNTVQFLHITASHRSTTTRSGHRYEESGERSQHQSLQDID
jgi:predicted nicotinamide N-methyase